MIKKIPENYDSKPYNGMAYYREIIMQNKHYAGIAEAVLNVYKASYDNSASDRIKVFKGRKSEDVTRMDTVLFKLRGGHYSALLVDLVKNPQSFMEDFYFASYNYKSATKIEIEGKETYVVEFSQKEYVDEAFYDGKLYIDAASLALRKAEFSISPYGLQKAASIMIQKKPIGIKAKVLSGNYTVDYRKTDGKWVLDYIHYDVKFKVDRKKFFFSKNYSSSVDFVMTDRDTTNLQKITYKEAVSPNEVFIDHVSQYYDENFWGDLNIIKPEESIQDAVAKISRKMNKEKK
jgi:hypothetical protein